MRVNCPHCRAPCLVAEQHLGMPVQCGRCSRTFTTRLPVAPPLVRLDIGAATAPAQVRPCNDDNFLVRQLFWCNLDERHELAVLTITKDRSGAALALAPLLNNVLNGTAQESAGAPEAILAALRDAQAAVVIWDGQVHVGPTGAYRVYHQRAGRPVQITNPLKLAGGDWLLVVRDRLQDSMLQAEFAGSTFSAAELAQQLGKRSSQTALAVRCY